MWDDAGQLVKSVSVLLVLSTNHLEIPELILQPLHLVSWAVSLDYPLLELWPGHVIHNILTQGLGNSVSPMECTFLKSADDVLHNAIL